MPRNKEAAKETQRAKAIAKARALLAETDASAPLDIDGGDGPVPKSTARSPHLDVPNVDAPEFAVAASARESKLRRVAMARAPVREQLRDSEGRVAALGRDGQILSRKRTHTGDKFYIPKEMIPAGWTYQFIAEEVMGMRQTSDLMGFAENGWTPVPCSRHPGMFGAQDASGPCRRDGLILVERPEILTQNAREEEIGAAKAQIRTQNEQFKPRLPGARDGQRGTGLQARRTIEGMPSDVGRPNYEMSVDEGLV